ncbi:PilW family protein [Thermoproteota archaeon]
MKIQNNHAFTLIEVMNVLVVCSILFLLTFGVFSSGDRLWLTADASMVNQIEVRKALLDMCRTIRGGEGITIVPPDNPNPAASNGITFVDLYGETITYSFIDSGSDAQTILETRGASTTRTLANNIKRIWFTKKDTSDALTRVIIDITAETETIKDDTTQFNLKKMVTLRNS